MKLQQNLQTINGIILIFNPNLAWTEYLNAIHVETDRDLLDDNYIISDLLNCGLMVTRRRQPSLYVLLFIWFCICRRSRLPELSQSLRCGLGGDCDWRNGGDGTLLGGRRSWKRSFKVSGSDCCHEAGGDSWWCYNYRDIGSNRTHDLGEICGLV